MSLSQGPFKANKAHIHISTRTETQYHTFLFQSLLLFSLYTSTSSQYCKQICFQIMYIFLTIFSFLAMLSVKMDIRMKDINLVIPLKVFVQNLFIFGMAKRLLRTYPKMFVLDQSNNILL